MRTERPARARRRLASLVTLALIGSILLPSASSDAASGASAGAVDDRWSGRWQVEGQQEENGDFVEFGVLTLELVTDGSLNLLEPDWPCVDEDLDYRGSYGFGGGGTLVGCESSKFDRELSMEYYANQPEGAWGQANMTFTPGSPPTWSGYYSPATTDPAGEFAFLQWRATKVEGSPTCDAPKAGAEPRLLAAEPCSLTIDFGFSHGGRPKGTPKRITDISTNGIGTLTFEPPAPDGPESWMLQDGVVRVVRLMEVLENDPDTVAEISERRIVLGLRSGPSPMDLRPPIPKPGDVANNLRVPLEVKRSNDPLCTKKADGKARKASVYLEAYPGQKHAGSLRIAGCPHHYFVFKDGRRVTVSVVLEPIR